MDKKIEYELKRFREFKRSFIFNQKEIVVDGENLYCDGELLKQGEEKAVASSSKWINVGYNLSDPFSKALSNLFPYKFVFREQTLSSIESFFQGIKIKDSNVQKLVFGYSGIDSNTLKVASDYNWKEDEIIYFQGKPFDRKSIEYDELVDEVYISAIQNPLYRNVLKNVDRPIIHSVGGSEKNETVFTRFEFEYMLNCLVEFLKKDSELKE